MTGRKTGSTSGNAEHVEAYFLGGIAFRHFFLATSEAESRGKEDRAEIPTHKNKPEK